MSTELKEAAITGDGFILEQPPTSAGILSGDRLALLELVGKLETELEELQSSSQRNLETLQQEYKEDKEDLASMTERITMALMERHSQFIMLLARRCLV